MLMYMLTMLLATVWLACSIVVHHVLVSEFFDVPRYRWMRLTAGGPITIVLSICFVIVILALYRIAEASDPSFWEGS